MGFASRNLRGEIPVNFFISLTMCVYKFFSVHINIFLQLPSIMFKLSKVLLVAAYITIIFCYLKITLVARSKDLIELHYVYRQPGALKKILKQVKRYGINATVKKMQENFVKPERLPTDLKYILRWTSSFTHYSSSIIPNGQSTFIQNNCEYMNCFITTDKLLLPDRRLYDVILFDETIWEDDHPIIRHPDQYYIFVSSESSSSFPICDAIYDSFYNMTWTYKLDSGMLWTYFTVWDKTGQRVGPKKSMNWIQTMDQAPNNVIVKLSHKRKIAAWFVSNCRSKSEREKVASKLSEALSMYKLKLDIFGWCGDLTCPKERMDDCMDLLERDYFFYLAFENSLSDDFVTEKVLYALQHATVPVVFGGADYTRFLPPGSYLDAGKMNATELAFKMVAAMKKPVVYHEYFRWHNHYTYKKPSSAVPDACNLCKMLNKPIREHSVVKDFRQWWLPEYQTTCSEEEKRFQIRRKNNVF